MKQFSKLLIASFFVLILVAFATIYLFVHNAYQRQVFETISWIGLIFFSILCYIIHSERKPPSWISFFILLLICYVAINGYIHDRSVFRLILFLGTVLIGTDAMSLFVANNQHLNPKLLLIAGFLTFSLYLLFFAYNYFFCIKESDNPYQQNGSLFGILLASQLLLFVPVWWEKRKTIPFYCNWLFIILGGYALFLLLISNGRAGWLGLLVGIIYLYYKSSQLQRFKKKFLTFSILLILTATIILVKYKSGSSMGRKLIYKVSAEMFFDKPFFGFGVTGFTATYNNYQARYFSQHSINSEEALLADNNWFAFNDYYQFIIENGLIGTFLLAITVLLFFRKRNRCRMSIIHNNHLAVIASLLAILVAAFFSYPLQFFPVIFHAILCVAIIFRNPNFNNYKKNSKILRYPFLKIAAGIVLIVGSLYFLTYNLKEKKAHAYEASGMSIASLDICKTLSSSVFADGNLLYQYARRLYDANRLEEARITMKQVMQKYPSNQVYKLSALIHQGVGDIKNTEADFKHAVFMVPNRIVHRYDLLSFYISQQDTLAIDYWSKSILSMPIKVPSTVTKHFQQSAATIRQQFLLNNKSNNK